MVLASSQAGEGANGMKGLSYYGLEIEVAWRRGYKLTLFSTDITYGLLRGVSVAVRHRIYSPPNHAFELLTGRALFSLSSRMF